MTSIGSKGLWLVLALVAWAALTCLGCAGAKKAEQPAEPAEPKSEVAQHAAQLQELEKQLAAALPAAEAGATAEPDCAAACSLVQRICDLSQKICELGRRDPENTETAGLCTDAGKRCEIAENRAGKQCACSSWP
jgi:hypothetical protein